LLSIGKTNFGEFVPKGVVDRIILGANMPKNIQGELIKKIQKTHPTIVIYKATLNYSKYKITQKKIQ